MVFPFRKKKKDKMKNDVLGPPTESPFPLPPPVPRGNGNINRTNSNLGRPLGPPPGPPGPYGNVYNPVPVIEFNKHSPAPSLPPPNRGQNYKANTSTSDPTNGKQRNYKPGHVQNQPRFGTDPVLTKVQQTPAPPDNSFSVLPNDFDASRMANPPRSLFATNPTEQQRKKKERKERNYQGAQPIPLPGMNAGRLPPRISNAEPEDYNFNDYPNPPQNLNKPRGYLSPEEAREAIALNPRLPTFMKEHPPTLQTPRSNEPVQLERSDLRRKKKRKKKKKLGKFEPAEVQINIPRGDSMYGQYSSINPPPVPPKRGRAGDADGNVASFGSTFFGQATTKRETFANKKSPLKAAPALPPRKKLNPLKSRNMQKKLTRQFGNEKLQPPPLPPRPRKEFIEPPRNKFNGNDFNGPPKFNGHFGFGAEAPKKPGGNFIAPFPMSSRFYG